jgi:phenylacetic acid degradation operon negative regulatory protein
MDEPALPDPGTGPAVREATRGPSASAVLFTVLGEFFREPDDGAWTGTLLGALGELGFGEAAARRALTRAASAGWVTSRRHGRTIRWSPSAAAVRHFAQAAEDVYQRRRVDEPWDGCWLVLTTSVPESQRALRHQLRTRLRWAGFGPMGQGVWVSPHVSLAPRLPSMLAEMSLSANVVSFIGRLGPVGSEYEIVRDAWDLRALSRDYRAFVSSIENAPEAGIPREIFIQVTRMVHQWRGFALRDPVLPPELLPAGWEGHRARALFYQRHDRWRAPAADWLRAADADSAG